MLAIAANANKISCIGDAPFSKLHPHTDSAESFHYIGTSVRITQYKKRPPGSVPASQRGRFSLQIQLHVELEVHNVAVLHHVVFAFLAQLSGIAATLFATQGNVVFI